ncbi:hypothetical protein DSM112329_00714 [Paraconexibacter sp. AEG42_29]|uniref:CENP-V/GFA domain-containing protein n=1 Tax=Paraconexibacter sp. AEG42_29 TaxID=2997339 RepID=A0AAU7AQG4_9ACTN
MSSPTLTAGCGCGAVRLAIDAPLEAAAYCHCTRCQRRSGTAAQASGRVKPGSATIVEGEDRVGRWDAGDGLLKCFCRDCGSALFAADRDTGAVVVVRLGAIDGDPGVRPQARQFVANAAPWEPIPDDGLPRFDGRLPG